MQFCSYMFSINNQNLFCLVRHLMFELVIDSSILKANYLTQHVPWLNTFICSRPQAIQMLMLYKIPALNRKNQNMPFKLPVIVRHVVAQRRLMQEWDLGRRYTWPHSCGGWWSHLARAPGWWAMVWPHPATICHQPHLAKPAGFTPLLDSLLAHCECYTGQPLWDSICICTICLKQKDFWKQYQ